MSPNLRRYLPFIVIAFFLLIVLPALFRKSSTSSTTSTPATQSKQTLAAINLIDHAEQAYQATNGRYTSHVADLVVASRPLTADLVDGFAIQLDVSSDGRSYFALVESPVLSVLRARHDGKISEENCVVVKSGTGVACPASASSKKASTSAATTTTSTTTG